MSEKISFQDEILGFERELEKTRAELEELQNKWKVSTRETEELRETLRKLRQADAGRVPTRSGTASVARVDVNPESGRPPRGARKEQIEALCRRLGRGGEEFRTVHVLNALEEIEPELTDGMRSYTYAVMATLEEEELVKKVGRGRWVLQ